MPSPLFCPNLYGYSYEMQRCWFAVLLGRKSKAFISRSAKDSNNKILGVAEEDNLECKICLYAQAYLLKQQSQIVTDRWLTPIFYQAIANCHQERILSNPRRFKLPWAISSSEDKLTRQNLLLTLRLAASDECAYDPEKFQIRLQVWDPFAWYKLSQSANCH